MKIDAQFETHQSPILRRIGEAVSHLIVPALAPLTQLIIEIKTNLNKKRADIRARMLETKIEGDAAAAGLMLPDDEAALHRAQRGYFALIEDRRDKNA